jgi:thiosulfate reductase cytochrome b subunit
MANLEVYRHNRVTRFTHWINAIALMILFMSGLMIFNAHPHLYWGSTSEPEKAFFSIGATQEDGDLRGYVRLYGQQLDTTGFLGVQQGALGPTSRAFPNWLTVPGYYSLASGRRWHFFFGWLFALNGLLYVVYNLAVGHMRKFFFTLKDAAKVPAMIAYYLHLKKHSPQEGEYNPLQKIAYTSVFVILTHGHVAAVECRVPLAAGDVWRATIGSRHPFRSGLWISMFHFRPRVHGPDPGIY